MSSEEKPINLDTTGWRQNKIKITSLHRVGYTDVVYPTISTSITSREQGRDNPGTGLNSFITTLLTDVPPLTSV